MLAAVVVVLLEASGFGDEEELGAAVVSVAGRAGTVTVVVAVVVSVVVMVMAGTDGGEDGRQRGERGKSGESHCFGFGGGEDGSGERSADRCRCAGRYSCGRGGGDRVVVRAVPQAVVQPGVGEGGGQEAEEQEECGWRHG